MLYLLNHTLWIKRLKDDQILMYVIIEIVKTQTQEDSTELLVTFSLGFLAIQLNIKSTGWFNTLIESLVCWKKLRKAMKNKVNWTNSAPETLNQALIPVVLAQNFSMTNFWELKTVIFLKWTITLISKSECKKPQISLWSVVKAHLILNSQDPRQPQ